MSLFISAMRLFDYNAKDRSEREKINDGACESRLRLKNKQDFRPTQTDLSSREALGEDVMRESPQHQSLRYERGWSSAPGY